MHTFLAAAKSAASRVFCETCNALSREHLPSETATKLAQIAMIRLTTTREGSCELECPKIGPRSLNGGFLPAVEYANRYIQATLAGGLAKNYRYISDKA